FVEAELRCGKHIPAKHHVTREGLDSHQVGPKPARHKLLNAPLRDGICRFVDSFANSHPVACIATDFSEAAEHLHRRSETAYKLVNGVQAVATKPLSSSRRDGPNLCTHLLVEVAYAALWGPLSGHENHGAFRCIFGGDMQAVRAFGSNRPGGRD